jgi:hypothetical protein
MCTVDAGFAPGGNGFTQGFKSQKIQPPTASTTTAPKTTPQGTVRRTSFTLHSLQVRPARATGCAVGP